MRGVKIWFRHKILPAFCLWTGKFISYVQWTREKVAQGVAWVADPFLFVGFWFFAWLAYNAYSGMEALPDEKAGRTLEWLKFYAYAAGGIVLIWQVRIANRRATALERTAALGEKGNITERFKNAIEHLGNPSESIRMGGIYGLYHVVRESRGYTDTVLKILCAHAKSIMAEPGYTEKEKPSNEIAAILDVLFPVIPDDENHKIEVLFEKVNISGWHLRGAELSSRNMKSIDGEKVNLSKATLSKANLSGVHLSWADLSGAHMPEADLSRAKLPMGNLSNAILFNANLSNATLGAADLSNANLCKGDLSGAYLSGAKWVEANLAEANLSNARVIAGRLLQAKTLIWATLDDQIHKFILRRKPALLGYPTDSPDEEE